MTLEEMKERKRILGYSNETLSKISGIPLGTVQKVLSGVTKSPRQKTIEALSLALSEVDSSGSAHLADTSRNRTADISLNETSSSSFLTANPHSDEPVMYPRYDPSVPWGLVCDSAPAYQVEPREYTIEDIEALPKGIRAELIDGKIYYMASPTRTHQKIVGEMYLAVANYIRSHGGSCEVYIPPFAVYLNCDNYNYVEPDLTVICDTDKLDDKGCHGAPDWVVEVMSPSSRRMDNAIKLFKYRNAGVREYWIIHPDKRIVQVYIFENDAEDVIIYSFEDEIPSFIYPDLKIRLADVI